MKSKTTIQAIVFGGVAILVILACQVASPVAPTPTSTPANTSTPASTPTQTVSPTPTPKPDISSAVLTLEDLPAGFEEFTMEELGLSLEEMDEEGFKPETVFVFVNTQSFQMIFGFNFLLTERIDRTSFDLGVSQPEMILPAFIGGMGSESVRDEKVLEGLEGIGEQQIGMTMVATVEELPMQVDVLMFRRDIIGAMIMSMTLEGNTPSIPIQEMGRKLDANLQGSLRTIK